jgi:citrate synthase
MVERGVLRYRGYPIEVLAEHCTFLEVAYLLLFGDLPDDTQLKNWVNEITHHTMLHETTKKFMEGFRYDAHPMAMLVSTVAALSTVYPEARNIHDLNNRLLQIKRLIAKMPSIAAMSYRHSLGFPYVYPDNDMTYYPNMWPTPYWHACSMCYSSCTPTTSRIAVRTRCVPWGARTRIPI